VDCCSRQSPAINEKRSKHQVRVVPKTITFSWGGTDLSAYSVQRGILLARLWDKLGQLNCFFLHSLQHSPFAAVLLLFCQFVFCGLLSTFECFQEFKASVLQSETPSFGIEASNDKSWKQIAKGPPFLG